MKANMFNGVMKAVVSLMFLGLAALPGHGLPLLSRPEYGVLYSSNGKIQNAASYWTMYFEVRKLTEEIVPQVVRKNLAGNHLCHVEISNNDTTPSSVKALKTMAEVCKGYETVIKKIRPSEKPIDFRNRFIERFNKFCNEATKDLQ